MSEALAFVDKTALFKAFENELRAGGSEPVPTCCDPAFQERTLAAFLQKPDALAAAVTTRALTFECAFLLAHRHAPWVAATVHALLDDACAARNIDPCACFGLLARWAAPADRVIRSSGTTAHLQGDKSGLAPDLLVKSLFRDIGDVLETSFQSFARLRLLFRAIARRWSGSEADVEAMTFGQVVALLSSLSPGGDVYRPSPFGIPVSQWRNIAQHGSYDLRGAEIECAYGVPGKEKQVRLTIPELIGLARDVNALYYAHKAAFEFFVCEHLEHVGASVASLPPSQFTLDSTLALGLVAAGFTIRVVGQKDAVYALVLGDLLSRTEEDARAALQQAVLPYLLATRSVEIDALIQSNGKEFWLSARGSLPSRTTSGVS